MPRGRRRRASSTTQCSYIEGRRRCIRNGFGNPPLCRTHQLALEDEAQAGRSPLAGVTAMFEDLLNGRRVDKRRVAGAVGRVVMFMFEGEVVSQVEDPTRARRTSVPPPRARPQLSPEQLARVHQLVGARKTLELPLKGAITVDDVKTKKRELARKYHPDVAGGSTDKMAAINAASDLLLEQLEANARGGARP